MTLSRPIAYRLVARYGILTLYTLASVLFIVLSLGGNHPPARAQEQQPLRYDVLPATNAADMHRDDLLVRHDGDISALQATLKDQWKTAKADREAQDAREQKDHDLIVGLQTEMRIAEYIIGIVFSGSVVLQIGVIKSKASS